MEKGALAALGGEARQGRAYEETAKRIKQLEPVLGRSHFQDLQSPVTEGAHRFRQLA